MKKILKSSKTYAVIAVILACVFLAGAVGNFAIEHNFREAIASKDINRIVSVYNKDKGSAIKMKRYDKIVSELLAEMTNGINDDSFDSAAEERGADVITEYLRNNYGSIAVYDKQTAYSSFFSGGGINSLEMIVSYENKPAYEEYKELLRSRTNYCNALRLMKNGSYKSAHYLFASVIENDCGYDKAQKKLSECIGFEIDEALTRDDVAFYSKMLADEIERNTKENETAKKSIADAVENKLSQYDRLAQEALENNDAEKAIKYYQACAALSPENSDYESKLDSLDAYKPFEIHSPCACSFYKAYEMKEQPGWTYSNYEKGYDNFCATFKKSPDDDFTVVRTYVDDKLVYTSPASCDENGEIEISFPLHGAEKFEIRFYGKTVPNLTSSSCSLKNERLTKSYTPAQ